MEETVQLGVHHAVLQRDGDRWHAAVPKIEAQGAATWGYSRDEALRNLEEVLEMIAEELAEEGRR